MNYTDFLIALMLWREARGEIEDGWLAILCVLRNRVQSAEPHWCTYYKAITERNAFSSMSYLGDSQTILYPDPANPIFAKICDLVYKFIHPNQQVAPFDDITDEAKYYCNPNTTPQDSWFVKHISNDTVNHPKTKVIGAHEFYK